MNSKTFPTVLITDRELVAVLMLYGFNISSYGMAADENSEFYFDETEELKRFFKIYEKEQSFLSYRELYFARKAIDNKLWKTTYEYCWEEIMKSDNAIERQKLFSNKPS